ncbi:MAG: UDP-N-acetylmuramate--L-alanine ligase [Gammaproteobacteria bacterium]|nr:UDP-N-acetylmuramate--L-alanine ligase [Gammaproteobacteria bacterium]
MANKSTYESWSQRQLKRIHFVGIGGVGMGGIAEIFISLGYAVSGSDQRGNALTERLASLGAEIFVGHEAMHVTDAGVVVVSTAIPESNPELVEARRMRIPVIRRAEMLAELMRLKRGIAIAGTHGKTTTTSLTASLLIESGLDATYVIGGKLKSSGSNARLGDSQWLVAEADESDASFLHLQPYISVVTNIDEDHMDTYEGSRDKLLDTFVEFIHNLPFYGLAVLCGDDSAVREIMPRLKRRHMTYGFQEHNDYVIEVIEEIGFASVFNVCGPNGFKLKNVKLSIPGRHNILNAVAGIVVGHELGINLPSGINALESFLGVGRRLEVAGTFEIGGGDALVVDDYGHHPTEIKATLSAAKSAFKDRRLVVIFQPHRYTRTRDLFDDFVANLFDTQLLVLMDVYAAGEQALPKADSKTLAAAIRTRGGNSPLVVSTPEDVIELLPNIVEPNDVILTMGAGNVGTLPALIKASFDQRAS